MWFTDRPVRNSGVLSNADFVKNWSMNKVDSFGQDNPNASLVAFFDKDNAKKQQDFVMRLASPVYDSDAATMQYDVQMISK